VSDRNPLPEPLARFYLSTPWVLSLLLVANALAFLVGIRYYLDTMASIQTFLWPLYGDSPTALALGTLVLATALPALGDDFWSEDTDSAITRRSVPDPLAVVTTLAVVWLIETGVWTAVALNVPLVRPDLPLDLYVGFDPDSLWAYWGIMLTHLGFLLEAGLVARLGRTSKRLLAVALVAALANDLFDYGFLLGLPTSGYPPIRYEPGLLLATASVGTSVAAVLAAGVILDRAE
jgi:uncharacterized membrane protein YpjA